MVEPNPEPEPAGTNQQALLFNQSVEFQIMRESNKSVRAARLRRNLFTNLKEDSKNHFFVSSFSTRLIF
jgi:hypothetical protein